MPTDVSPTAADRPRVNRRVLNWRLLLALGVTGLLWAAIVAGFRYLT